MTVTVTGNSETLPGLMEQKERTRTQTEESMEGMELVWGVSWKHWAVSDCWRWWTICGSACPVKYHPITTKGPLHLKEVPWIDGLRAGSFSEQGRGLWSWAAMVMPVNREVWESKCWEWEWDRESWEIVCVPACSRSCESVRESTDCRGLRAGAGAHLLPPRSGWVLSFNGSAWIKTLGIEL